MATNGSGYALLTYTGSVLEYEFHLFGVQGLKNIELHIGEPGSHGDVATVFYAANAPDAMAVSNGIVATGTTTEYDLVGPFLLPLGNHLEISLLHKK